MSDFINKVKAVINKYKMIEKGDSVVVGISGGADSVCLLSVLSELKDEYDLTLIPVHINHNLRGEESLRDEKFTSELCKKFGFECHIFSVDIAEKAAEYGTSNIEDAARNVRYEIFESFNVKKIAVAHNKNDLAETVIFRMIRGSSIRGIGGMRAKNKNIIRPLIDAARFEIEKYLQEKNIEFITDSTNLLNDYSRNKIRHDIIPKLIEINHGALNNISKLSENTYETEDYLSSKANEILRKIKKDGAADINKLNEEHSVIVKKVLSLFYEQYSGTLVTANDIDKMYELIKNGKTSDKCQLHGGIYMTLSYGRAYFLRENEVSGVKQSLKIEAEIDKTYKFYDYEVKLNLIVEREPFNDGAMTYYLDYAKIPDKILYITARAEHDSIKTKTGTKLLKKYMIDKKIPREERDMLPVLRTDCGDVIAAALLGINFNYKIDYKTKRILKIEFIKGR